MATFTIPQRTPGLGPGSFTTPNPIGSAVSTCLILINQVGWTGTGGRAFSYSVDYSPDNGTTFITVAGGDYDDTPVPAARGFPANQIRIGCVIPDSGNANRLLRLSWDFAKSLTISGSATIS